ncbi:MAG: prolipoprotein diacylglyceryl transferase [Clostridiales bacterium]|nr:prolipoprotein diacylglyceryl transferase [Clostridiales bacterium]
MLFGVVHIYGVLIALAIGLGVWLCSRREKRMGLKKDTAVDLALWVVPAALIGARLYYVAFQWDMYKDNPVSILYVWRGGLAIYGGVIGGLIGGGAYCLRKKAPFLVLADLVAPALILGQAVGRWGNYFNGEAYGYEIKNAAWQFFPAGVQVDGVWHMATFFYESLWDFLGFVLLWSMWEKVTARGNLFLLYLCWYGLGRAVIEGLRTDSLMWGGVRVSQALSAALVLAAGIALILRRRKHRDEKPYPAAEE